MNGFEDDTDIWELRKGDILIGTLDVYDQDMFWFTARFIPTAEFEPYRQVFSEGQALVGEDGWYEWLRKINSFGMRLIRAYNQAVASEFILYINDNEAGFRPNFDKHRSTNDKKSLLPQNKLDVASAEAIVALGQADTYELIPDLLHWLQDYNWPVAKVLAPFLETFGISLTPYLRDILMTNDGEWKYWIMRLIIAKSPQVAKLLHDDLQRIAMSPTESERSSELDILAQEILQQSQ
jgi:hypothetical protein